MRTIRGRWWNQKKNHRSHGASGDQFSVPRLDLAVEIIGSSPPSSLLAWPVTGLPKLPLVLPMSTHQPELAQEEGHTASRLPARGCANQSSMIS
eukprot:TRINITY_DN23652_c0_g2_i5.p1 TRINITY_DN23652_c0_g2~~TRINITY_DN23652_c0_g2_i5.p1  ORF type:complete len:109 (+),score=0.87 TRINITY_DN23652_c0_g2_i5:47-328(+)